MIDGDRGKNYPTEADFEPHGHTLFLNASNVTIDGFLFDTNQFITEEKSNSMGSGKIIKDDIIITSRGSLGHIAWYNDSVQQVMPHLRINSGMLILRNKANVKTSYLHQFMKSDKGKAQIVFMSFGSAQPQLTKKGVESFTVNYPIDTEEQIKIGAFFSKIDNTITLQQRKLNSLQKLKKGLLQKMFPKNGENIPEIRFPEFSDAWKQRKFSEVFEEYSEKKHPELPALTIIQGKGTILRDASDRNLLYDKANLASYKLVRKDDFIVHLRTFEGGLEKANSDGIVSPAYHIFHGKNTDTRFFYPFFRSKYFIDALLKPHVYGIRDGKSIDIEGMKTISFLVPSFEEQNKIGKFVETLDNTITLQQRKLESLQKLKKGLLQQMFI